MKIVCPECKKIEQRSEVRIYRQIKGTDVMPDIYFDESGNKHIHSYSFNHEFYRCSNGHKWDETFYPPPCPTCSWETPRNGA